MLNVFHFVLFSTLLRIVLFLIIDEYFDPLMCNVDDVSVWLHKVNSNNDIVNNFTSKVFKVPTEVIV